MVGGEESVSAVQHACSTAGPTGQQHRCHRADTAASARHREPGVADVKKKQNKYRADHTHPQSQSYTHPHRYSPETHNTSGHSAPTLSPAAVHRGISCRQIPTDN